MEKENNSPKDDKIIIRTQWKRISLDSDVEHPFGSSLVEPDQSYSIREILDRFSRGAAPAVARDVSYGIEKGYEESLDDSDFESSPLEGGDFDIADLSDMKLENDARIASIKEDIKNVQSKKVKNGKPSDDEQVPPDGIH